MKWAFTFAYVSMLVNLLTWCDGRAIFEYFLCIGSIHRRELSKLHFSAPWCGGYTECRCCAAASNLMALAIQDNYDAVASYSNKGSTATLQYRFHWATSREAWEVVGVEASARARSRSEQAVRAHRICSVLSRSTWA